MQAHTRRSIGGGRRSGGAPDMRRSLSVALRMRSVLSEPSLVRNRYRAPVQAAQEAPCRGEAPVPAGHSARPLPACRSLADRTRQRRWLVPRERYRVPRRAAYGAPCREGAPVQAHRRRDPLPQALSSGALTTRSSNDISVRKRRGHAAVTFFHSTWGGSRSPPPGHPWWGFGPPWDREGAQGPSPGAMIGKVRKPTRAVAPRCRVQ